MNTIDQIRHWKILANISATRVVGRPPFICGEVYDLAEQKV